MFSKLTINAKNSFTQTGLLCESLMFYQNANLILDHGSFYHALSIIGYRNLVELINEGDISVCLNSQALGVGNPESNKYLISSFSQQNHDKTRIITEATEKLWGRNIQSNNQKNHLIRLIGEHQYSSDYDELLSDEILDTDNFKDSIVTISKGEISRDSIEIEIVKDKSGLFEIQSNLNNNLIEDAAYLICIGSGLLYDSNVHNSELVTNSIVSTYPSSRVQRLLDKRTDSEQQIKHFHEFVLKEFYDLKSTVDSGAKDFNDFMELLRVAKKFKSWLKDEEHNVELLNAYIRKISENSWLDKVPVKTLRWILFTSAGLTIAGELGGALGTIANVTIDFFDDILFDGIFLRNYEPNQFVENEYKDFLNLGM